MFSTKCQGLIRHMGRMVISCVCQNVDFSIGFAIQILIFTLPPPFALSLSKQFILEEVWFVYVHCIQYIQHTSNISNIYIYIYIHAKLCFFEAAVVYPIPNLKLCFFEALNCLQNLVLGNHCPICTCCCNSAIFLVFISTRFVAMQLLTYVLGWSCIRSYSTQS